MKSKNYEDFRREANRYKKILLEYKNNGTIFVDPNFHPTAKIIERTPKVQFTEEDEWVRVDEISNAPLFQKDLIDPDFVRQGGLGDCYLFAAISRVAQQPELIQKFFNRSTPNQVLGKVPHSIDIKCGAVVVYFHCFGRKTPVLIDTLLPKRYGELRFGRLLDYTKSPWFLLIEKAYAKLNGSYSDIIGGTLPGAIYNMFGYYPSSKKFKNLSTIEKVEKMPLFDRIMKYQKQHGVMGVSINLDDNDNGVTPEELEKKGLIDGHCYLLKKARILNGKRFLCLRNPWGEHEWNGDWSDSSPLWTPEIKEELGWKDADDGTFWMNDTDFFRYFTEVEVSKPIPPEWHARRFFVQLKPGDHDGFDVDNEKAKMMERPNFAFQVTDPIQKGESCRFYVLVEKRHKLFNEKDMTLYSEPHYCIYFAHSKGQKLDPNELPYMRRMQVASKSTVFYTRYSVDDNDDIVTIALNRLTKCDLIEDCYVLVYCEKDFKLFDIDKPDELIEEDEKTGFVFNNFSVRHPSVAPQVRPARNRKKKTEEQKQDDHENDDDKKPPKSNNKSKIDVPKKPKEDDDDKKPPKSNSQVTINIPKKPKDDDDDKKPPKSNSKSKIDAPKKPKEEDDDKKPPKSNSQVTINIPKKPKDDDDKNEDEGNDDNNNNKPSNKSKKRRNKINDGDDEMLDAKNKEIERIKQENEKLKELLAQMAKENKKALESKDKLIANTKKINRKLREVVDSEKKEKEKAVAAYKKLKATSEKEKEEMTQELTLFRDQMNEIKKKTEEVTNSFNALKKEKEKNEKSLNKKIAKSRNEIKDLKSQVNQKQNEIEQLKLELEKLRKNVESDAKKGNNYLSEGLNLEQDEEMTSGNYLIKSNESDKHTKSDSDNEIGLNSSSLVSKSSDSSNNNIVAFGILSLPKSSNSDESSESNTLCSGIIGLSNDSNKQTKNDSSNNDIVVGLLDLNKSSDSDKSSKSDSTEENNNPLCDTPVAKSIDSDESKKSTKPKKNIFNGYSNSDAEYEIENKLMNLSTSKSSDSTDNNNQLSENSEEDIHNTLEKVVESESDFQSDEEITESNIAQRKSSLLHIPHPPQIVKPSNKKKKASENEF